MSSIVVMTVVSQGIVVVVIVMENIVVVYFFDLGNFESQIVVGVDDTQVVVDKLDWVSFAFHTEDTVARKNLIFCDDEVNGFEWFREDEYYCGQVQDEEKEKEKKCLFDPFLLPQVSS
ncbi:hypothetical protein Tco_0120500 [Tanacetum coccineum]